jgi:hypothetical protein
MALIGQLVPAAQVTPAQQGAMFALMDRHYENVTRARFDADLAEKDWVILLCDKDSGEIGGFSTQMLLDAEAEGRPIQALFSGDTIVDRDRWGDSALSHVWGRLALSLIDRPESVDLYWFLISKGYRTYRFLPVFFHEFYPRHDRPTPVWARAVIDALAQHKYPDSYDARSGVIRASANKDRLRAGIADLTDQRLHDPHVRFFASRNPGHADGDELCCIAPLTRANFTPAAYRVIGPEPVCAGEPG